MSTTVVVGSTATFTYTPDLPTDGMPTVVLYDAAGDEVELTNSPVDSSEASDLTEFILTLEALETGALTGECRLVWIWTWTDDEANVNTVRDVEPFTMVEYISPSVGLTVGTNSYVTIDEANAYLGDRLGTSAWESADSGDRGRALRAATRAIDAMPLRGRKTDDAQALEFPRAFWAMSQTPRYTEEHERWSAAISGAGYDYDTEVPQRVKDAVCEEALALLVAAPSTYDRTTLQQQGVTSVRIGDFQESYAVSGATTSSATALGSAGRLRSVEALALMRPYVAGSVRVR